MSTSVSDGKAAKMLDALQSDLKALCMETKKRYPHIKDVSKTRTVLYGLYNAFFSQKNILKNIHASFETNVVG